jgi:hypothetical protein
MRENLVLHSKPLHRKRATAALVAGLVVAGGAIVGMSPASAVMAPRTPVDLAASTSAPPATGRFVPVPVTVGVSNLSATASDQVRVLIAVTGGFENGDIPTGEDFTCAAPTNSATGFTQECVTDPVAAGASRSIGLSVSATTDQHVGTMSISTTTTHVESTLYVDPVGTNNRMSKSVTIQDSADLAASLTGASSVSRDATYDADGALQNNGPDPVYAKLTLTVTSALEAGFTFSPGLSCTAAKVNLAGTGFSRVCTTTSALPSGASLPVHLTVTPTGNLKIHGLGIVGAAAKVSGAVTDVTTANNRAVVKPVITDSADLSTTLSGDPLVMRGSTTTLTGTMTNSGPDPVYGKTVVKVAGGVISSITADAPLNCVGTGATRTCTLTAPIAPGTTLHFSVVATPSQTPSVTLMNVTSTVSVLGGIAVSDPDLSDNVATVPVAIDHYVGVG